MTGTEPLRVVILGLSISSSWGNGHATTYRALVGALAALGHDVLFLERDVPWYRENRDCDRPEGCRLGLYTSLAELRERWGAEVRSADAVMVGSYVPQGCAVIRWVQQIATGVTLFYDIDTPVTLAKLERGDEEYVARDLIPGFEVYLSFTGGPILERLEREFGARRALPLYCSVDVDLYRPKPQKQPVWDLGYLGTYSDDRRPKLERLLVEPARRDSERLFAVAGPGHPVEGWPENVAHRPHLPPGEHADFYNRQRFTLNLTRDDMVRAGFSPSVRLFEAAACGTPIISDPWPGLETLFEPGEEILLATSTEQVLEYLRDLDDDARTRVGRRGRDRVLAGHTARHRAVELVHAIHRAMGREVPEGSAAATEVAAVDAT